MILSEDGKNKRTNKRVYCVMHIISEDLYRFPRKLRDFGEYMSDSGHYDIAGNPLRIGDVVSVGKRYNRRSFGKEKCFVIAKDKFGGSFVMGYGDTPIEELKVLKTVNVDLIKEAYKECGFIIGDEETIKTVNEALWKLKEKTKELGIELDSKLNEETLANIHQEFKPTINSNHLENMRVSDIRNLIKNTVDEEVRSEAKRYLQELLEE